MPLTEEYDLSGVATDVVDAVRDVYDEAVDDTRMQEIEEDAAFLLEQYEQWPTVPRYAATPDARYQNARALTAEREYAPEALYRFACEADLTRKMSGLFLSGVIDTMDADHVRLPPMPEADYAFYENAADVTVEGGVGDKAGYGMQAGTVTIGRDTGTHCGRFMEDGTITVHGDAGTALGHAMTGGRIHVHGDAGDHAGLGKRGGLIVVDGDLGRLPHHYGAASRG